jgi:hypothetical protein
LDAFYVKLVQLVRLACKDFFLIMRGLAIYVRA